MLNNKNLALALDISYNPERNKAQKVNHNIVYYGSNQFIQKTQRAMILRENILASGMEISDISKATDITKHVRRT